MIDGFVMCVINNETICHKLLSEAMFLKNFSILAYNKTNRSIASNFYNVTKITKSIISNARLVDLSIESPTEGLLKMVLFDDDYVYTMNRGFVCARELSKASLVIDSADCICKVISVKPFSKTTVNYDIEFAYKVDAINLNNICIRI